MRIRDKIFEEEWKKTVVSTPGSSILVIAHLLFGLFAIAIIIIQSAFSFNVYIFSIWLIFGIIIFLTDLFRGRNIKLSSELGFGFFFILGTVLSLLLGNVYSMFFPENLGRIDILIFQISAGICVAIRFLITFFYEEYFSQEQEFIVPDSNYAKDQIEQYILNLVKTDFEYKEIEHIGILEKWWYILKKMIWPSISISILVILAVLYSLLIYYIIPNDAISELIIVPSLIIAAILYSILLIRLNDVIPKIQEKEKEILESDEWEEDLLEEINEEIISS
ncbi:MAG: hypothetical protein H7641_08625 [Candidatus Heimdallarchaeota archaeon]|nr:hypothetical protein [Candidatus Heimdallarchaeota archaeon]MCK4877629.1 hypothetical protein [Candidatus Heimdallarchaeota archaeon]